MSEILSALTNIKTNNSKLIKQLTSPYRALYNAIHHHHSTRGKKMNFTDYKYLVDVYLDSSPEIYIKSSVQSGKSEWAVVTHLTFAEMGLTVLYVLPDDKLRTRFTRNRVDKMFQTVPHYAEMYSKGIGGAKNVNLKHYGRGTIVYAHSGSVNDFKELPADILFVDEFDQCNMENMAIAEDRLSSSDYKLVRYIANPTVSNYGIDEKINKTDNKFWHVKCDHCGHWQSLDFFKNIVYLDDNGSYKLIDDEWDWETRRDINVYCQKCHKEIDRLSSSADWVAKHPNRLASGYNISKIFSPHNTISELWDNFYDAQNNESKLQTFYNSDLGLCYEASGSKLSATILDACKSEYRMTNICEYPCVIGIDVGRNLHTTIWRVFEDGDMMLVGLHLLKHFEEVDGLIERFNVKSLVVDAMPETRKSLELCERHPNIAYMCYYTQNKFDEMQGLRKVTTQDSSRYVISADRLLIMDNVMEKFITSKFILPSNANDLFDGDFYDQLCVPTRIWESDGGTDGRFVYTKGQDHWYHSTNYALMARYQMRDFSVKFISNKMSDSALRKKMIKEQTLQINTTIPQHLQEYWKAVTDKEAESKRKN